MIVQKELIQSLETNSNKIAIEIGERKISYSEVLSISNQVTNYLLKEKLGEETIIGLLLPNQADLICSMIGTLNARCVFVPIDGSLPDNRLASILADLDLQHLILSKNTPQNPIIEKNTTLRKFFLEDMLDIKGNHGVNSIQYPEYGENDSIYVYFTSGSTGRPKGIVGKNSI